MKLVKPRALKMLALTAIASTVHAIAPLAALAQSQPEVEAHSSAEDCAVIAAIGEDRLKWHEKSPAMPMLASSFGADCDWRGLGVQKFDIPPLGPGPYYPGVRFSFSQPSYSVGGQQAVVAFTIGGRSGPKAYFFQVSYCVAEKRSGSWRSTGCKPGPIT